MSEENSERDKDFWASAILPEHERKSSALDRVTAERDAALAELEMARDDLVIFKSAVSALGEASKKLVFCARTSGGTAGPDQGLMDACAGVEGVITLGGIARAMNEFERLIAERDALQQRLTAVDERADVLEGLLRRVHKSTALTKAGDLWQRIDAALKPAEGGGDE